MKTKSAVMVVVLVLAGAGGATGVAAAGSDTDTVVDVSLIDYEFEGLPATVEGPDVRFDAVNRGPSDHELEVLDADGEALGEIEAMPPGETGSIELELEPGTYRIQCLVPAGDATHAEMGMVADLEVE